MKYVCFGSNNLSYNILDKENNMVLSVKNGIIEYNTKKCKRMYDKNEDKMGNRYYGFSIGKNDLKDCMVFESDILLETDNRKELDLFILNSQKKQFEFGLENVSTYISKVENGTISSNLYAYGGK